VCVGIRCGAGRDVSMGQRADGVGAVGVRSVKEEAAWASYREGGAFGNKMSVSINSNIIFVDVSPFRTLGRGECRCLGGKRPGQGSG
jgi:hypothetical protein